MGFAKISFLGYEWFANANSLHLFYGWIDGFCLSFQVMAFPIQKQKFGSLSKLKIQLLGCLEIRIDRNPFQILGKFYWVG